MAAPSDGMIFARPEPAASRRAVAWASALTGLALFTLYVSSLTADNTHDSVYFAMSAEAAVARGGVFTGLFHPQHVLHQVTAAGLVWLAQAAGLSVGALVILQLMSSAGAAALGAMITRLVARGTGSVALGVATALAAGLAGGTWYFAVDGECNLIALALVVAAIEPSLRALEGHRGAGARAAVLLALACGWHLTMGLVWIALLLVASLEGRAVLRRAAWLLGASGALLALLYLPRLVLLLREPGPFDPRALITFTNDLIEGGYLLDGGFDPLGQVGVIVKGFLTVEPGSPGHAASLVLGLVPLALIVLGGVGALRRGADALARVLFAWFLGAFLLYSVWDAGNFEFTNFLLVPGLLAGVVTLSRIPALARGPSLASGRASRPRAGLGLAAAALALASLAAGAANWALFIRPGLDPQASPYHRIAAMVEANTRPEDRVITCGLERHRLKIYVLYHAKRAAIIPEFLFGPHRDVDDSVRGFEAAMDAACASGARVYSLSEMVEDVPMREVKGFPLERLRALVRARHPVEVARDSAGALYLLECPGQQPE